MVALIWLSCTSMLLCSGLRRGRHAVWKSSPSAIRSDALNGGHRHDLRCSSSSTHANNVISSPKSQTVKILQSLLSKRKARQERGETLVEGPRMIRDLLANPKTRPLVRQIVVAENRWDQHVPPLLEEAGAPSEQPDSGGAATDRSSLWLVAAAPHVLQACTDTVTNQGIVARVAIPTWDHLMEAAAVFDFGPAPLFVVSDGIGDPGNLGTLIRSSVATGVAALLLLPESCDVWSPKAVRAAMGATFGLPVVPVASWQDCQAQLQQWGCRRFYASTMLGDDVGQNSTANQQSVNLPVSFAHYQVEWTSEPTALIIGSEGLGLSSDVRSALESRQANIQAVHVPMEPGIESLNAGVCGSVILFEYLRQKRSVDSVNNANQ